MTFIFDALTWLTTEVVRTSIFLSTKACPFFINLGRCQRQGVCAQMFIPLKIKYKRYLIVEKDKNSWEN